MVSRDESRERNADESISRDTSSDQNIQTRITRVNLYQWRHHLYMANIIDILDYSACLSFARAHVNHQSRRERDGREFQGAQK